MRSTSFGLLVSVSLGVLAGAVGTASAQERGADMVFGEATLPPVGFLAFCETSPTECAGGEASPQAIAEVRGWASRARWTRTFAEAGIHLEPQSSVRLIPRTPSASTSAEVGATISEAQAVAKVALSKAATKRAPKVAPKPKSEPLEAVMVEAVEVVPALVEAQVQLAVHRDLETVNRHLNRAIRRSTDEATFGQVDVWAIPEGPRARGDCEDYAMAKRRALIEMGISPETLSLAIVRTRAGEIHAVLLAETEQGEFVLDNLSPWVVRWDSAPYEWLERQVRGSAVNWVRLNEERV